MLIGVTSEGYQEILDICKGTMITA